MPNHVTNKLIIAGPNAAVTELIREVAGPGDNFFCLNRIIPMPLVLRDTESGTRAHWPLVAKSWPATSDARLAFNHRTGRKKV